MEVADAQGRNNVVDGGQLEIGGRSRAEVQPIKIGRQRAVQHRQTLTSATYGRLGKSTVAERGGPKFHRDPKRFRKSRKTLRPNVAPRNVPGSDKANPSLRRVAIPSPDILRTIQVRVYSVIFPESNNLASEQAELTTR
jgi:hypothetical protein